MDERTVLSATGSGAGFDNDQLEAEREGLVWRFHSDMRSMAAYSHVHQPFMDVLRACLNAWPHCLTTKVPRNNILAIIFRSLLSADAVLAVAASDATMRFASRADLSVDMVAYLGRSLIRADSTLWETHSHRHTLVQKAISLFQLWSSCFTEWQEHLQQQVQSTEAANISKAGTWTALDETEAHCAWLMVQPQVSLRRIAAAVLDRVAQVDSLLSTGKSTSEPIEALEGVTRMWHLLRFPISQALEGDTLAEHLPGLTSDLLVEEVLQAREAVGGLSWKQLQGAVFRQSTRFFPTVMALVKPDLSTRILLLEPALSSPNPTGAPSTSSAKFASSNFEGLADSWSAMSNALAAISTDDEKLERARHTRQSSDGGVQRSVFTGFDLIRSLSVHAMSNRALVSERAIHALDGINHRLFRATLLEIHRGLSPDSGDLRTQGTLSRAEAARLKSLDAQKAAAAIMQNIAPYLSVVAKNSQSEAKMVASWITQARAYLSEPNRRNELSLSAMRIAFAHVVMCFVSATQHLSHLYVSLPVTGIFALLQDWQGYAPSSENGPAKLAALLTSTAFRLKDDNTRSRVLNEVREDLHRLAHKSSEALASLMSMIVLASPRGSKIDSGEISWQLATGWVRRLLLAQADLPRAVAQ